MHLIEKLMLIHNIWFFNYGLVHVTRISTLYQNKLLSKKSIFSRSTLYFQIKQIYQIKFSNKTNLSCREFYADYFKHSNFKTRFKIRFLLKIVKLYIVPLSLKIQKIKKRYIPNQNSMQIQKIM